MARIAKFNFNGSTIQCVLQKVEREDLYGWSKIEVYDEKGGLCKLAGISDGHIIMPSGTTALISLDAKGEEVKRSELIGVDANGKKVKEVLSIYEKEVKLQEASLSDFLDLSVKSVYCLDELEGSLKAELDKGKLFFFLFNYRTDYEGDDAFILKAGNAYFAIVGKCADFQFIGLEDNETALAQEIVEPSDEIDEFDFAMF